MDAAPSAVIQDEPLPAPVADMGTSQSVDSVMTEMEGRSLASSLGAYAYYEVDLYAKDEVCLHPAAARSITVIAVNRCNKCWSNFSRMSGIILIRNR